MKDQLENLDLYSPAHLESERMEELSQLLLLCDPQATYEGGATALHLAADHNLCHIAAMLLSSEPAMNVKDDRGDTPLHRAVNRGHEAITELLLAHRADPNRQDRRGMTPLHRAVIRRRLSIVKLLLAYGAATAHPDYRRVTPLQAADEDLVDTLSELFHLHAETDRFIASLPEVALTLEA